MSKERARRRAERESQGRARAESLLAAPAARPAGTGALGRLLGRSGRPWWRLRSGRRRYSRRTRAQRGTIAVIVLVVLGLDWLFVDEWGARVGLSLLALLATPALVTMALGRSHR